MHPLCGDEDSSLTTTQIPNTSSLSFYVILSFVWVEPLLTPYHPNKLDNKPFLYVPAYSLVGSS